MRSDLAATGYNEPEKFLTDFNKRMPDFVLLT